MSESEYKLLVLADYDEKALKQPLPAELLVPTPGNIKAEIVKICEQGLTVGDEKILRSFVGEKLDAAGYRNAFLNRKADPFRPLVGALENRSVKTHIRNIDLLALLIDYRPRPYHPGLEVPEKKTITDTAATGSQNESETGTVPLAGSQDVPSLEDNGIITEPPPAELSKEITEKQGDEKEESDSEQGHKYYNKRMLFFVSVLFLVLSAGGYIYWHTGTKEYTGHEKCMVWNDDRYEPVECDKTTALQSYPINQQWVEHFRRITTPDTLTPYSVGKVWYANYKGRMEFFNDSAAFPLDTNRRLLPMTDHILKKYVYHISN
ncbi:hypothetical protein [Mucilaginibacter celer]|uniref:Uncharacterized protein n=1 Tax=Mucilaginibacter celer TaxID=2305508 RepID=A0A494VS97_9SPHI|nr:hypothetical protein [Mucilaginibacter celer]AYL94245.1 hypothetical protein HYN43_002575 [Mucilaginibacter celer]